MSILGALDNRLDTLLQARLAAFPRKRIAHLPTPLEKMDNFSNQFGLNIFVKRDDQTGLAFGGNKARKLEFIIADALAKKANVIITWGGVQSNWCRQVAAAAKKVGIRAHLVLFQKPAFPKAIDGNYFLDQILGADITLIEASSNKKTFLLKDIEDIINPVIEKEKALKNIPYVVPVGGSLLEGDLTRPLGAISYVDAFAEMYQQMQDQALTIDKVIFATGSGGTHAGLLVGAKILSPKTKIIAMCVGDDKTTMAEYAKGLAIKTLAELGVNAAVTDDDLIVFDEFGGDGYGVVNDEVISAIKLFAQTEGLLFDPVYTGKAMYGFMELINRGYFNKNENIVVLHTGGTPALFPYKEQIF